MADLGFYNSSAVGANTDMGRLLMCQEIQPGSLPSYQICKTIYAEHPVGKKMIDAPIAMAQSQQREIVISDGSQDRIREAFLDEFKALRAGRHIANLTRIARIYGIGSLALVVEGATAEDVAKPIDMENIWKAKIGFNVLDPLNTSGNMLLNQDPNSITFQNTAAIRVAGWNYHPSRTCVMLNEAPLYIAYTSSAFGYVGRSVFQRALFPLKSFVQTMRTDDLVTRKAGVIIAKIKQVGSAVDNVMSRITGAKREIAKDSITDDVMSIGNEDTIESLNLGNLEGPYKLARTNIIENIALAGDMPAKILNSETFADGFGEGTEDAKNVARYVEGIREDMQPAYDFVDAIVQRRAWNPDFYKDIQKQFPDEYGKIDFNAAFYKWSNSFSAVWPSLLIEPDSEKIKVEDVKIKGLLAALEVLMPALDPENKATLIQWAVENFNELKLLFPSPVLLDYEGLRDYVPPEPMAAPQEPAEPKPFAASDALSAAVARLPERRPQRQASSRS
jgi:hypothetical protein